MPQSFLTIVDGITTEDTAIVVSTGALDAGKITGLDETGKLSVTVMPTGIGASTQVMVASEPLEKGALVNVYDNAGVDNARNANATDMTKPAQGFVLEAVTTGGNATVYTDGINTALAGLTTGSRYYTSTVNGKMVTVAPNAKGNNLQFVGYAINKTTLQFQQSAGIKRAK